MTSRSARELRPRRLARAAGQASSVAHSAGHASAADAAHARERAWQLRRLPSGLRAVAIPAWRKPR